MLKIKITGSGSRDEIVAALQEAIVSIKNTTDDEFDKGVTYEDETLCSEVRTMDDKEESKD